MKKILSLALGALAATLLLLCATACDKEFDPTRKDDFIGTYWKAQNAEASFVLSFKKDYVKLRVNLKDGDGYYVLSGDYEYYPETSKVVITYGTTEEKYHYDTAIPAYILANGNLSDDKSKMVYQDTYVGNLTFLKD
ncbi:MAG: hypothetical protein IK045_06815 [Bacteroidales bacterium]|nr:hypothetical protein [Bacteroidales bacterium]